MNDLEHRLRRGLTHDAGSLPDYPQRIRPITRRGRRRTMTTRLSVVALAMVVLGGGLTAFLVLRDGDGEIVVAAGGDDAADAATADEAADQGAEVDPGETVSNEPPVAASDDASAEPAGLEGAPCLGFAVYCLGGDEQDAVAAATATWGPEEAGPIFEGEPPDAGQHVWFPSQDVTVNIRAYLDGSLSFVSLMQPVTPEPSSTWEIDLPAGLVLGVDTLDTVLDTLGPPDEAFPAQDEGIDILLLRYEVGSSTVSYGYVQSWSVGLLEEYSGLVDAALVDAVRGRALPLRFFGAAGPPETATEQSLPRLALRGLGDVVLGMSQAELIDVAFVQPAVFEEGYSEGEGCGYVIPKIYPGLGLMVTNDEVVRIDVFDEPVLTLSGIGIGSTEAEVLAAYGDRISEEPHPYLGDQGKYLVYVPQDAVDAEYRLVFETASGVVTNFRAGQLPEVLWIEGCS